MIDADILIPHRSDDGGPRDAHLQWVTDQYHTHFPDWDIHVGTHTQGLWDKAAAVADALAHSSADILIITDNDVWVHSPDDLLRAVAATPVAHWALPHTRVYRLDEAATALYTDDPTTDPRTQNLDRRPYHGVMGGGIFAITRQAYVEHGGLDPRFLGHTGQDISFGYLMQTLVGDPWRGRSDLVHLYHPANPAKSDPALQKTNRALLNRYHRARHRPQAMARLQRETRELSSLIPSISTQG